MSGASPGGEDWLENDTGGGALAPTAKDGPKMLSKVLWLSRGSGLPIGGENDVSVVRRKKGFEVIDAAGLATGDGSLTVGTGTFCASSSSILLSSSSRADSSASLSASSTCW